jgi:hypothetical protein
MRLGFRTLAKVEKIVCKIMKISKGLKFGTIGES